MTAAPQLVPASKPATCDHPDGCTRPPGAVAPRTRPERRGWCQQHRTHAAWNTDRKNRAGGRPAAPAAPAAPCRKPGCARPAAKDRADTHPDRAGMCRVCRKLAADAARVAVTPTPTPKAAPKRDVPSRKPAAPAPAPKNPTPALFPPTQRPRARVQLRGLSIEIEGDSTAALGEVLATLARAFGGEG